MTLLQGEGKRKIGRVFGLDHHDFFPSARPETDEVVFLLSRKAMGFSDGSTARNGEAERGGRKKPRVEKRGRTRKMNSTRGFPSRVGKIG